MIDLTNGNVAAAQELLRHKHMSTTMEFYRKQTQNTLTSGIEALDSALQPKVFTGGERTNTDTQ